MGKKKGKINFGMLRNKDDGLQAAGFFRLSPQLLVTMENYQELNFVLKSTLAYLNEKQLIEFVKFCLSYKDDRSEDEDNQNCWSFL